jgi:hypothetical protein
VFLLLTCTRFSESNTVLTPSSSSGYSVAVSSHTSSRNSITTGNQHREPSSQLPAYLSRSATADGSLYGRLVGQPQNPDPYSRIGFYTVRAQQTIDRFEEAFESPERQ